MKTVLVVEGDGHDSAALQALLQDHGYTVSQARGKSLQVSEVPQDPRSHDGDKHESAPLATFRSRLDGKLYTVAPEAVDTFEITEPPQGVEQHFHGIYEKGPLGIFRTTLAGKLLSINPAGARMLKFDSPQDMIEVVNRTDIAEACYLDSSHRQEILAEVLPSRDWQVYEEQFRCKDDSVIDCYFHMRAVCDDDGRPVELEGFLEDVSERKRVERALHFTQFAVDKTIDQAFWMDEKGRFVYVNDAACDDCGYSRQELLGMSIFDIDSDCTRDFFGGTWRELKRHCSKTFERHHRTKDGRIFPVEVRANYLVYEGREYVCFFASDISERKKAEEKLRRTNEMLRAIIEAAPTAIIGLDLEGKVCNVWNPAAEKMLGWSTAEVMGRLLPSVPVEGQEQFRRFRKWAKCGKTLSGIEVRRQRKDGTPIDCSIHSSPLKDADGCIVGNISVLVDVTERKRAEEALKLSQFMIDRASLGIFRGDDDGRILFVNDYGAQSLGYTAEELCTLSLFDIDPNLTQKFWRAHRQKMQDTGSNTFESLHRRKDGTVFPVEITVNYLRYGDQVFTCSFAVDITERKQKEEALQESERKYRSIIDHAPFGITHSTRDGSLLSVNPALASILKYDSVQELRETINRSSIQDVLFPKPSERAPLVENILSDDSWYVFNNRLRCKDGSVVTCRVHSRRILDADGNTSEFESYQENITDQVLAEEALRESEEKFRVLAETSPVSICIYQRGKIIYANPATEKLLGYSLEELSRMKFWDWGRGDFQEGVRELGLARSRGEYVPGQYEGHIVSKSGENKCLLVSAGVMEYQGRSTGVASFLDITERKRSEELIKTSLAEKEVLLREIHHRVKNNLQVVSSLLYLQSQKLTDPELQDHFLESQNRICSMALAHEQLYQSKSLAEVSVKSYVESLVGQLRQVFQRPGQQVECQTVIENIVLDIEKVIPCGLLITELLSNAYKHAFVDGRSGTITITMKQRGEQLALSVTDDGVGLPADLNCRQTTTLGLQLVTALTNQLNGTLEVNREGGTLFRVVFAETSACDD